MSGGDMSSLSRGSLTRQGDWKCPCGNMCFASKNICKRCGIHKPIQKKAGDWYCCSEVQFASRSNCMKCGRSKPNTPAVGAAPPPQPLRAGDWLCKNCNDVQFGSRVTCRKCNASKPAPESEEVVDNACLVCMDRVRNAGLVHGDDVHSVTCLECASTIMNSGGVCPLCRRSVERVLKTYN